MKLILIRHPETIANAKKLIYGHADWGYSEAGEIASDLAAAYVKENYDYLLSDGNVKIFATPLKRTKILADKIVKDTNLNVEILDHLIELNVGILENMTTEEAKEKYEDEWEKFSSDSIAYRIPEGESWTDVYERVAPFVEKVKNTDTNAILVSHAMVIRSLLAHIIGIGLEKTWHFNVQPSGLIEIDFHKGYGMIKQMIDFHEK